jgi:hypothetical protein
VEGRSPAASPAMLRERGSGSATAPVRGGNAGPAAALGKSRSESAAAALALLVMTGARKQEALCAVGARRPGPRHADGAAGEVGAAAARPVVAGGAAAIVRRQLARREGLPRKRSREPTDQSRPVSNFKRVWAAAPTGAGVPGDARPSGRRERPRSARGPPVDPPPAPTAPGSSDA